MRRTNSVTPSYRSRMNRNLFTLAAVATVYSVSTSMIEQDQQFLKKPSVKDNSHNNKNSASANVQSNPLVGASPLFSEDELDEMAQVLNASQIVQTIDKRLLAFYKESKVLKNAISEHEKTQSLRRMCLQLVYADIYKALDGTWKLFAIKTFARFAQNNPDEFNFAAPEVRRMAETVVADSAGVGPLVTGRNFLVIKLRQTTEAEQLPKRAPSPKF